jgi:hypothetical protein
MDATTPTPTPDDSPAPLRLGILGAAPITPMALIPPARAVPEVCLI